MKKSHAGKIISFALTLAVIFCGSTVYYAYRAHVYEGYADSYIADEALIEDALLLENQLNMKEEAMECYSKLFDYYTASVYVAQARKNYRRLRDELNK